MPDWFEVVEDGVLLQGDILSGAPYYQPAEGWRPDHVGDFELETCEVMVINNSCDLAKMKPDSLILVARINSQIGDGPLSQPSRLEMIRRGHVFGQFMLPVRTGDQLPRGISIVSLLAVCMLPVTLAMSFVGEGKPRLRLTSPYREKLSRAFAECYGRVATESDIPPFDPSGPFEKAFEHGSKIIEQEQQEQLITDLMESWRE